MVQFVVFGCVYAILASAVQIGFIWAGMRIMEKHGAPDWAAWLAGFGLFMLWGQIFRACIGPYTGSLKKKAEDM